MTKPNQDPRPNMMYEWQGYAYPPKGLALDSQETMAKLDGEAHDIWHHPTHSSKTGLARSKALS